ncbi:Enoyl-CoA hydratase isomerase family protein [Mycena indigotica]|uniref:Enoyl-CoA hydratase isomerase family protein n=1 Tax=Mycena indigotica TaxID=2126181 RepID=A0A8H6WF37_9AGAR|nr:Enoyl-CoA hydratase isomerase family protein [Mycena indigotica]KAF7312483.1 Enoyl-CoA hydratase isomerase family protein [Mycena indigotica]
MATADYSALGLRTLNVSLEDGVLVAIQNRSKAFNTWDEYVPFDIIKLFELADKDDRVRVVILSAEPTAGAYCGGAALDPKKGWNALFTEEEQKEGPHAHRDTGGKVAMTIYRCRKLTIAAVNGHAAGVGMTAMQLPFDLRFVWSGARLSFPFIQRGITPEATSTFLLPKLLGHSRATSLLLTGATFSPDSPIIAGLYHQSFPTRAEVFPAALAFAKEIAATTSQLSVAVTKALIQNSGDSIEENHLLDSFTLRTLGPGVDGSEGILSFLQKRAPKFTGTLSKDLGPWFPWWREVSTKHRNSKL